MQYADEKFAPRMAATIGFLALLGTATADIPATNDYVIQLRSGTAGEVGNMTR